MFKNLIAFRLPDRTYLSSIRAANDVGDLQAYEATPPSTAQLRTFGFARIIVGNEPEEMAHEFRPGFSSSTLALYFAYREYKRDLPSQAVKDALAARIAKLEEREGRKVRGKEKAQLREEVIADLLPRAFIKHKDTSVIFVDDLVLIDTSSHKLAEEIISMIRRANGGTFPAVRVKTNPVVPIITKWIGGGWPEGLAQAGEAELIASNERKYKAKDVDLDSDDAVTSMLDEGGQAHRLRMHINEEVEFTLDGDLAFRRIKPYDTWKDRRYGIHEERETEGEARLSFDADLYLISHTLIAMLDRIVEALGGEIKADAPASAPAEEPVDEFDL